MSIRASRQYLRHFLSRLYYLRHIFLSLIVFVFTFCIMHIASAQEYSTNEFNVNISIKDDRTYQITEDITVHYIKPKHGIFRYLPKKGDFIFGEKLAEYKSQFEAVLTNPNVLEHPYTFGKNKNDYYFLIGDEDVLLEDKHNYALSYEYRYDDDGIEDFDMVYHNVIPHEWPAEIRKLKVVIQLPKPFDPQSIEVVSGKLGGEDTHKVGYSVQDNTVIIENTVPLERFEGVSFFLRLPQDYFNSSPMPLGSWAQITIITSLVFALAVFLLWFFKLKEEKLPEPISFYPPHNFNPVELAFYANNGASIQNFSSLLLYFAHKDYLSFQVTEDHTTHKKQTIVTKLKDLETKAKGHEKLFFSKLFEKNNTVNITESPRDFYKILTKSNKQLNAEMHMEETQSPNTWMYNLIFSALCVLPFILMSFGDYNSIQGAMAIALLGVFPIVVMFIRKSAKTSKKQRMAKTIILSVMFLLAFGFFTFIIVIHSHQFYHNIWVGIIAIFCSAIGSILGATKFNRSLKEIKLEAEINGFKTFIEVAEADKLNSLIDENPNYFYDILPYAYVLGLSTAWLDKLQLVKIPTQELNRYAHHSGHHHDNSIDNSFASSLATVSQIDSLISETRVAMARESSRSSGSRSGGNDGGSGGSSSSGGGGGGGGGGSW